MKKIITLLAIATVATGVSVQPTQAQIQFQRGGFDNSVVDVALSVNAENGEFSTLIAALTTAGLVPILDSLGPLTVLAPTDAAFAAAGITASSVSELPKAALRNILLNHVVFGALPSSAVLEADKVVSLAGSPLRPRYTNSGLFIVDAKYAPARVLVLEELFDIPADNGIVHVIDNVLKP